MNRYSIERVAMTLLGHPQMVSSEDNIPVSTPTRTICNNLFLIAVRNVLEHYPWTFLRVRERIMLHHLSDKYSDLLNKEVFKEDILNQILTVDRKMCGAVAQYNLSYLARPYRCFLRVYSLDWGAIIDYSNSCKTWWITTDENENLQLYTKINPIGSDGLIRKLNIEYSSYKTTDLDRLHVPANIELCISYCLAHLACVAITGSNAEATRLYQQYQAQLEQCKLVDNKTSSPAQVMTLSNCTSNQLLGLATHNQVWWNSFI